MHAARGSLPVPVRVAVLLLLLLLLLACCCCCCRAQLYQGEKCQLANGGDGVCQSVSACPWATEQIGRGEWPKICSFVKAEPIVCCLAPTTPQPASSTARPEEAAHSLAAAKCLQYSRAVPKRANASPFSRILPVGCGSNTDLETQVVGGTPAAPREFPHMAALGFGPEGQIEWKCGGSLISERFVLTVAHCLSARGLGAVDWVSLGSVAARSVRLTVAVAERLRHEGYRPPSHYNDIALLRLEKDVTFSRHVLPACMPDRAAGEVSAATATGWGKTDYTNDAGSEALMKVTLTIQEVARCNHTYRNLVLLGGGGRLGHGIDPQSMICAGDPKGGKDTCVGDSGGPLQVEPTIPHCMHSIIGLTSFGVTACGIGDNPAVYTRVSHFVPWIAKHVWPQD